MVSKGRKKTQSKMIKGEKLDFGMIQRYRVDHEATLRLLKRQYSDLHQQVEAEKEQGEKLKQIMEGKEKGWWNTPINDLNLNKLESLMVMFEDLYSEVLKQIDKVSIQTSTPTSTSAINSTGAVNLSLTIPTEGSTSANPHGHGVGRRD